MPRNQISGLSVCLECPEIRFPVSPCVWNARKSDLRICRTTSLPEHDVDGGTKCHRVKNCLVSDAFALGDLHKIFRIELRRIEAVIKKDSDAQLRFEYIRDRDACREIGVKLVADLGDFDLLGLFGFFLVKREKRVVADVVDTQQELAANKEMIGHGVRKIGADACGDVVERVRFQLLNLGPGKRFCQGDWHAGCRDPASETNISVHEPGALEARRCSGRGFQIDAWTKLVMGGHQAESRIEAEERGVSYTDPGRHIYK